MPLYKMPFIQHIARTNQRTQPQNDVIQNFPRSNSANPSDCEMNSTQINQHHCTGHLFVRQTQRRNISRDHGHQHQFNTVLSKAEQYCRSHQGDETQYCPKQTTQDQVVMCKK